jgi:hypothetical protein
MKDCLIVSFVVQIRYTTCIFHEEYHDGTNEQWGWSSACSGHFHCRRVGLIRGGLLYISWWPYKTNDGIKMEGLGSH